MKYQVIIDKSAAKFISKLPKPEKEQVLRAIQKLSDGFLSGAYMNILPDMANHLTRHIAINTLFGNSVNAD